MGCSNSDWNPLVGGANTSSWLTGSWRNQMFGTDKQADAAQAAAQEARADALRMRDEAVGEGRKGLSQLENLSAATPQELTAYGSTLEAAQTQLNQGKRLLEAIDPAIMEASKQILDVLQGRSTGVGNALGAQRNQQRQQLVNQLRSSYGPGAETSSIGQQALQKFDMETNTLTAQTQNSTLGALMATVSGRPDINNSLAALSGAGQNFGNIQTRRINAYGQGQSLLQNAMLGTGSSVIQTAGADQVKQLTEAGAQRQFWDNWANSSMRFGEAFGGAGITQGMGGGKGGGGKGGGGSGVTDYGSQPSGFSGGHFNGGYNDSFKNSGWQPMSYGGNYWYKNPYSE